MRLNCSSIWKSEMNENSTPEGHRKRQMVIRDREYSVSASLMIVLIALISSVQEVTALIAIFGANVGMILFGLAMEHRNPAGTEKVDWRPFTYCRLPAAPLPIPTGIPPTRRRPHAGSPWAHSLTHHRRPCSSLHHES